MVTFNKNVMIVNKKNAISLHDLDDDDDDDDDDDYDDDHHHLQLYGYMYVCV